ncbi:MAG TPA: glucose 1-dehydrogenase [Candidatus Binatia bacterium]|nr:glucose 1-dehydrogenase [Candidatus Binatia bacterium]
MSGRLAGKVTIVTGAAQGIGAAYARALAAEGARLMLCDVQPADEVAREIEAGGGEAAACVADVTDARAVAEMVQQTERRYGGVHVLVNNAALFGTLKLQPFTEIQSEEWDRVMAVNTRGPFECVKAVVPAMRRQKYGKIVNIASGTLFKGTTHLMHYVASKGAVVAMTRVMARELGEDRICVNCIAPGLTMSENVRRMYGKQGEYGALHSTGTVNSRCFKREEVPEDITGALVFLASAESDFITGQTLLVDGGSVLH